MCASTLTRRQAVLPRSTLLTDAARVLGGAGLVAASAQVSIPLPFTPVPITGQTFAVLLVGALLGARLGTAAMVAYITEGLVGLPVFAAAPGSFSYGYLAGFMAAALVVGWFADRGWTRDLPLTIVAMVAGEVAIYFFGLLWLAHLVPPDKVLAFGLYPFLIGDAIKLVAAALVVPAGRRLSRGP